MKTIFKSFITALAVAITGLISYHLFRHEEYNTSSLLILTSYLSIVLGVYILTNKKPVLQ